MAGPDMKKMIKEFLKLGDFEMEKKKFHNSKELIDLGYWYPMRVYDKNKETNAKYFFGYKTGKKNRTSYIEFPQMPGFVCQFKKIYCMSIVVKDKN